MSRYKGISLDAVRKILTNARTAGFDEIQINYIAGIDSLADFKKGIDQLMKKNLVDSIGLSTFVAFDDSQVKLRHESAWNIDYYKNIVNYLYSIGLKIFHPESFDMALLYAEKLEKC